jgi:hypothetical protein
VRDKRKPRRYQGPEVIIGFDAEWTERAGARERGLEDVADGDGNHVLSFQFAVLNETTGEIEAGCITTGGRRLTLAQLVGIALSQGMKAGVIRNWPEVVTLAGHFTRSDLSHFADFANFKGQVDCAHRTYVSFRRPVPLEFSVGGHRREVGVRVVDTMLLAPAGRSLDALGELIGVEKVDLAGVDKGQMDVLMAADPELFERYAIRDAVIAAKYAAAMFRVQREMGLSRRQLTIGGMGVAFAHEVWDELGFDPLAVRGHVKVKRRWWDQKRDRYVTKPVAEPLPLYEGHRNLATQCYHGGRNECFAFGPTAVGEWFEHDVTSAYPVAMAAVRMPDYERARSTTDEEDFRDPSTLGFALVKFRFKPGTRFPCLPVDAGSMGLVYPLAGQCHVASPEIALALAMGADIEVLQGVVVPWRGAGDFEPTLRVLQEARTHASGELADRCGRVAEVLRAQGVEPVLEMIAPWQGEVGPWRRVAQMLTGSRDGARPFAEVVRRLMERRAEAAAAGDDLLEKTWKQMINSLYGKISQGIKPKTVFDTRAGEYKNTTPSRVTCPYVASFITSAVRALVSELMARLPAHRTAISVTTDGIVTDAPMVELDFSGPIARTFAASLAGLGLQKGVVGTKAWARQLLPWKTRGCATLVPVEGRPGKLAQGGVQTPPGVDRNAWMVELFLNREAGGTYVKKQPIPFADGHRENLDFRKVDRTARYNLEFDFKRRPVGARMAVARTSIPQVHLSFETVPWVSAAEFLMVREQFERWREHDGGVLRTVGDFERWVDYQEGAIASRAGIRRRKGKGVADQARRAVVQAWSHRVWNLPGGDYKGTAAWLTEAGYPTTVQDFKDAKHRGGPPMDGLIPADAPGVRDLIAVVLARFPEFEWQRMVTASWSSEMDQVASCTSANDASYPEVLPSNVSKGLEGAKEAREDPVCATYNKDSVDMRATCGLTLVESFPEQFNLSDRHRAWSRPSYVELTWDEYLGREAA